MVPLRLWNFSFFGLTYFLGKNIVFVWCCWCCMHNNNNNNVFVAIFRINFNKVSNLVEKHVPGELVNSETLRMVRDMDQHKEPDLYHQGIKHASLSHCFLVIFSFTFTHHKYKSIKSCVLKHLPNKFLLIFLFPFCTLFVFYFFEHHFFISFVCVCLFVFKPPKIYF